MWCIQDVFDPGSKNQKLTLVLGENFMDFQKRLIVILHIQSNDFPVQKIFLKVNLKNVNWAVAFFMMLSLVLSRYPFSGFFIL